MSDVSCPLPGAIDYKTAKSTYAQVRKDTNYKLSPEANRREAARRLGTDYDTFSKVLASKGKAVTAVQAPEMPAWMAKLPRLSDDSEQVIFQGANPGYRRDILERNMNCTLVSNAYEMRRRGFNVAAKGKVDPENTLNTAGKWRQREGWSKEAQEMNQKVIDAGLLTKEDLGIGPPADIRRLGSATVDGVLKSTHYDPVGARYLVSVEWRDGGAHMFNAEKTASGMRFIDAQVKNTDASGYFDRAVRGSIIRVDDCEPSESILNYFEVKP